EAGEVTLTDEQKEALAKARQLCRLKAAETLRLKKYNEKDFDVPEPVRPWVAGQVGRAGVTTVKGAKVIEMRDKVHSKAESPVPDEARRWLDSLPPTPRADAKVLSGMMADQVFDRFLDSGQVMFGEKIPNPRNSYMLLSIIAIIVFWLGCNNAAKE